MSLKVQTESRTDVKKLIITRYLLDKILWAHTLHIHAILIKQKWILTKQEKYGN